MRATYSEALQLAEDAFRKGGLPAREARIAAEIVVEAEARGRHTHGLVRIPVEFERLKHIPWSLPSIEHRSSCARAIDGGGMLGYVVGIDAADLAVEIACEQGLACVAVRNVGHTGPLGLIARRISTRGLVSVITGHSMPLLAYPGRKGPILGTNPIAVGFPQEAVTAKGQRVRTPVLVDSSMAVITRGEVLVRKRSCSPLPPSAAIDAEGAPTTDALAVEALLPIGGAKGAALSLAVQALCVMAGGDPVPSPGKGYALLLLAIKPDLFVTGDSYAAGLKALCDALLSGDPISGAPEIRLPGEEGDRLLAQALDQGLDVDDELWREIRALVFGE